MNHKWLNKYIATGYGLWQNNHSWLFIVRIFDLISATSQVQKMGMQTFELITREGLALETASPPRESGGLSKSASRSGCLIIVKASSEDWKSECLTLAEAGEIFMVDELHESSVLFYKNLCYVFRYRVVMTALGVFFAPAPAP